MKNNLLSVCVDKCADADEKVLTYNDMLELIVLNKIQRGDFDGLLKFLQLLLKLSCNQADSPCLLSLGLDGVAPSQAAISTDGTSIEFDNHSISEFVEEITDGEDPEWEESVDESCEWFCSECDGRGVLTSKKLGGTSENNSMRFLCAGYTDCMDEAIRFLVEEEKISPEHPVVRNLKAHLEHSKERILDAASEVISRLDVDEESRHSLRTEDGCPAPVNGFLDDLLRAWNTG